MWTLHSIKNMVGAFNQPKLVYMNLDVLKTLPKEQFASGMAEALKSGLIRDQEYFIYLCDEIKAIQSLEAGGNLTHGIRKL